MVVVSVYVITSVEYDEVRCVPFSMNTTTGIPDGTCGYGPAQAAFVNAQCAAILPLFYQRFGILLVGYSVYGFFIDSSWLMNPMVINAINEAKLAISENKEFKTEVLAIRMYNIRSCSLIIYLMVTATIVIVEVTIHYPNINFECSIAPQISHSIAGQYSCNFPRKELVEFIACGMIVLIFFQVAPTTYGIKAVYGSNTFEVFGKRNEGRIALLHEELNNPQAQQPDANERL